MRFGVHGDPLKEGKLDLPELLETPTSEEWAWAREFIACRRWREAVTYRETAPHEYTVHEWDLTAAANADFERFTALVRECGYALYYPCGLTPSHVGSVDSWDISGTLRTDGSGA